MAVEKTTERIPAPGLFVTLRTFFGAVLATACTRFELAGVELEEQAIFGARLALSGIAAVLCAATAFFFLMLLIVAIFWDEKVLVLSIILGVYVLGAIIFAAIAKSMAANRPKLMAQTLAEIRKDVDALRKPISTVKPHQEPVR
jgi:uncharacterized membrane protein YqjE